MSKTFNRLAAVATACLAIVGGVAIAQSSGGTQPMDPNRPTPGMTTATPSQAATPLGTPSTSSTPLPNSTGAGTAAPGSAPLDSSTGGTMGNNPAGNSANSAPGAVNPDGSPRLPRADRN